MARRTWLHRTVAVDVDASTPGASRHWRWPWYVPGVIGPLGVLLGGWVLLAALAILGWLTSPDVAATDAMRLAGQVLLLAHGGTLDIGGLPVSLAPLGLTALLIFLAIPVSGMAAQRALATHPDQPAGDLVLRVGGTFGGVYAAGVVILAAFLDAATPGVLFGGLAVGGIAGLWGAARGVGYDPTDAWPGWLGAVPRAMAASLFTVLAGGSAALAVALYQGRDAVTAIVEALGGGAAGLILLTALHLAYLPNLILAATSWILGAGFTLGDGSLISMSGADVGVLPAIPAFGIVPAGEGSWASLWWLAVGALAGAMAGLAVAWARPRARFDETALVGGLSGVLAGLVVTLAAALGSGGLGAGRLVHVGPRVAELALFAPTLLGLGGMATGLVLGLIRRPDSPPAPEPPGGDDEATGPMGTVGGGQHLGPDRTADGEPIG